MNIKINIDQLSTQWLAAKEIERVATESRRTIEDQMMSLLGVAETLEGTENFSLNHSAVKIVGRMNRKVDIEKLQEIAADHDLTEHLSSLFRWKAEINSNKWKEAADSITQPLLGAITTTPGRPSFSITTKD